MRILFLFLILLAFQLSFSQDTYTINNETLQLKTEVEGSLDLLWNTFDGEYRYFVRTEDGTITELKNTKNEDRRYQEEYKTTLNNLTNGLDTSKLKLTLYDLKQFIDRYNASVDSNYQTTTFGSDLHLRLGFSGGITNNPFVGNPENIKSPMIGAELELFDAKNLNRHAGFIQLRHSFENDDFPYSTTELSLGYRYRFINKDSFSIYGQVKLGTLNFGQFTLTDENNMENKVSETSFDIPLIFGVGADIKVGQQSFITIIYGELFALLLENQGNFSTDIAIGYKFNL